MGLGRVGPFKERRFLPGPSPQIGSQGAARQVHFSEGRACRVRPSEGRACRVRWGRLDCPFHFRGHDKRAPPSGRDKRPLRLPTPLIRCILHYPQLWDIEQFRVAVRRQ